VKEACFGLLFLHMIYRDGMACINIGIPGMYGCVCWCADLAKRTFKGHVWLVHFRLDQTNTVLDPRKWVRERVFIARKPGEYVEELCGILQKTVLIVEEPGF